MAAKKHHTFADFIAEPHIGTALLVIGLIALVFSIIEFSQAINY